MGILKDLNKKIFVDNKKITTVVGMITIIVILAAVFSYEASAITTLDAAEELAKLKNSGGIPGVDSGMAERSGTESFTGTTRENQETTESFDIPAQAISRVKATLHWSDTGPSIGLGLTQTNQPDNFGITITYPGTSETASSGLVANDASSGEGNAVAEIKLDPLVLSLENFEFTVTAGDCGDVTGRVLGLIRTAEDTDNSWDLTIEYFYYDIEE